MNELRGLIVQARNRLTVAAAHDRGEAIQLDHELGREILMSAQLKFRAAALDLFAAILGAR